MQRMPRWVTRSRLAILAVVMLAVTGASGTGLGESAPQRTKVHFSEPSKSGKTVTDDRAIERQLLSLIEGTPEGERIRAAIYLLGEPSIANALVAAADRGVQVRVLGDADKTTAAFDDLKSKLADYSGSFASYCEPSGCIGKEANHNKFALFSRTGDQREVIFQTSANWVRGVPDDPGEPGPGESGPAAHNFALTLTDEPKLYDAYAERWADMDGGGNAGYDRTSGKSANSYHFPAPSGENPILNILGNVRCPDAPRTVVRVAMMNLTDGDIASKLNQLDDSGCRVIVAHTDMGSGDDAAMAKLKQNTRHLGPIVYTYRSVTPYVHSKYLLIDGNYSGVVGKRLFAGSVNYTKNGVHDQDEAMLKLWGQDGVYDAFLENFNRVADDYDGKWHDGRVVDRRPEER